MYRTILFLGLVCIGLQSTSQTTKYSVNFDDPYKTKAMYLYLSPVYIEGNRANIVASGYEVAANFDYKKNFTFFANYRKAYIDNRHKYDKLNFSNKLEVGGVYYFSNKEINVYRYVTFQNGPDVKKTYIMKVPGTLRREYGFRLSYYNMNTPVDMGYAATSSFYRLNKISKDTVIDYASTSMNSKVLALGFDLRRILNLSVNAKEYGDGEAERYTNMYLDFLMSLSNTYKDLLISDTLVSVQPFKKSPFGWRFGYQIKNCESSGLVLRLELGKRPEWKDAIIGGYFLNFSFGWGIPIRIKSFEE